MAINFPNNPAVNDTFTVGGITFTWNGSVWNSNVGTEISTDATPQLGGALDAGTHNINNVGVITATSFSGNVTGNLAGNADTATTATTATNAQGLTGDPSIQVTNATVLGNLDVQGTTTTIDTAVTDVDSLAVDGNITAVGNLGLGGQTSPAANIHIGDISNGYELKVTGNAVQFNRTSNSYIDQLHDTGSILFRMTSSNTEAMRITSSGQFNVGSGSFVVESDGDISTNVRGHGHIELDSTGTFSSPKVKLYANTGNAEFAGTIEDSIGSLRDVPLNDQSSNASYTLIASDAGKVVHAHSTTATVVVPNSVFSVGNVVTILNGGTGNIAINQGSGLSLRNNGDGSTGNRTLAQYGMATIYFTGASVCYISGSNMT